MSLILGGIYITFIILTMFLIVRDRRNSIKNKDINERIVVNAKDKKLAFIIVLCTMLIYYIIGYIFKTDIFNAITLRKNGVSFSFIGMILLFITSLLIGYIVDIIRKKREGTNDHWYTILLYSDLKGCPVGHPLSYIDLNIILKQSLIKIVKMLI